MEELETRCLLSGATLDLAQSLGSFDGAGQVAVLGNISNEATGAGKVDWFQFSLAKAAMVDLHTIIPSGSNLQSVLGVYNNDPFNFTDPEDTIGHRLLAQDAGSVANGGASFDQPLAAGTYWVAVSGAGNYYFHPFIAGSGYPGSTGDYQLTLQATDLAAAVNTTPTVLSSNPGNGAIVNTSPLVIRIDYSAPLDTNTIDLSATQLIWSPTSNLADPNAQPIMLKSWNFSTAANELQLVPASGLQPGYYGVFLADGTNFPVLQFQVAGIEGGTTPTDTAATAHNLGDLTSTKLVQVTGAIGNDPSYNPSNADPLLTNPAAQANLYHFQISGPGQYAFGAEVFAGRIGSALDPGVSLYQWNSATQHLDFIDGNDNTLNSTQSMNGMTPLYTDAMLCAGLTAGDYYVAVSGGGNTPERALNALPGQNGIFDPNFSHRGTNGATVGNYVLNLTVQADNESPRVVAVTPGDGTALGASPLQLTVQFSESMNVQALAYRAFQQTSQFTLSPAFVEGADGTKYFPRFVSYDDATHQATFLMLDGLANGVYHLHLSGPQGLTDLAGNALAGNGDPSGDYVTSFTVAGPARGTAGNPLVWSNQEPNDTVLQPQNLGVLFPNELQTGVTVVRDFTTDPAITAADSANFFEFQVIQNRPYSFILSGANLPGNAQLQLYDTAGNPVSATITQNGEVLSAQPGPGIYVVSVSWTPGKVISGGYQLGISQGTSPDNPPPLTVGPGPASMTILVTRDSTPPVTNTPPPTTVPSSNGVAPAPGTDLSAMAILLVSLTAPSNELTANGSDIPPLRLTNPPVPGTSGASGYLASLGAGLVGGIEDSAYSAVVATSRPALAQRPTPRRTGYLLAQSSGFEDAGQNSSAWRSTTGTVLALYGSQRGDFFSDRDGSDWGSSPAENLTSDGQQRIVEDNHERAGETPSSHDQGSGSRLRRALAGLATLAVTGVFFFFPSLRPRRQELKPLKEGDSHDPTN